MASAFAPASRRAATKCQKLRGKWGEMKTTFTEASGRGLPRSNASGIGAGGPMQPATKSDKFPGPYPPTRRPPMRKMLFALPALLLAFHAVAAPPKSKVRIALIVESTVDDKGWCQAMHDAISAVQKKYGPALVEYSY